MSELLPCPFCGKRMIRCGLDQSHWQQWWEHEDRHNGSTCPLKNQTISDSSDIYKAAWNTRTPSDAAVRDAWLPIESAKETDLGIFWLELRLPVAHYEWGPTQHYHFGRNLCWSSCYKATHWMPLPAAPDATATPAASGPLDSFRDALIKRREEESEMFAATGAQTCAECDHLKNIDEQGRCLTLVWPQPNTNEPYPCGCRCVFGAPNAKPVGESKWDDYQRSIEMYRRKIDYIESGGEYHFCDECGTAPCQQVRAAQPAPTTEARERAQIQEPGLGGEVCKRCGQNVADAAVTWWHAPDELWLRVEGSEEGIRCIPCFTKDCDEKGILIYWQAVEDGAATPSISAAIAEVERLRDEWNLQAQSPLNDLKNLKGVRARAKVEAAEEILEALQPSTPQQKGIACPHNVPYRYSCPICDGGYECDGHNCPERAHDHYATV